MKYLSICSGVDSCSLAWTQTPDGKGLGWEPVGFSEIEKFPSAVLKHHYPDVPNLGDMTAFREWPDRIFEEADLIVGGTPCQAFSHAGKRRSLDDERGNLTLTYTQLINHADRIRLRAGKPRPIVLWENVPGVLTTPDNALGCLFSELSGEDCSPIKEWSKAGRILGRGRRVAWCVLDSQYFGVPQRRRRVFALAIPSELVDDSSIPDPGEILSIATCLRGNTPARPQQGKDSSSSSGQGSSDGHWEGGEVHPTLNRGGVGSPGASNQELFSQGGAGLVPEQHREVANCLRAQENFSHREDTDNCVVTPSAEPLQDVAPTLTAQYGDKYGYEDQHINGGAGLYVRDVAPTVTSKWAKGTSGPSGNEHHNLVTEAKWWDGSDVAPTQLTNSQNQFMPDQGKLNAIVEPKPQAFYSNQNQEMPPEENILPTPKDQRSPTAICIQNSSINKTNPKNGPQGSGTNDDLSFTLDTTSPHAVASFTASEQANSYAWENEDTYPTLTAQQPNDTSNLQQGVRQEMIVRRLTPIECERLMGFPDNYTQIPWKGKPAEECPDGPRYKACGNSMVVPVMRWLGERIQAAVED